LKKTGFAFRSSLGEDHHWEADPTPNDGCMNIVYVTAIKETAVKTFALGLQHTEHLWLVFFHYGQKGGIGSLIMVGC
jgi:hypothetical protein